MSVPRGALGLVNKKAVREGTSLSAHCTTSVADSAVTSPRLTDTLTVRSRPLVSGAVSPASMRRTAASTLPAGFFGPASDWAPSAGEECEAVM